MSSLIKIFQIHYKPDQVADLDPAFTPYDNAGVQDPLLEYGVLRRIHRESMAGPAELWGAVSWKFEQKTGLNGATLLNHIEANPGFDVYFCNPFPEFEALYHNLWVQGETAHPEFVSLVDAFIRYAGLDGNLVHSIYPSWAFAATNYMVGTPAFWHIYTQFVDGALAKGYFNAPKAFQKRLQSAQADAKGIHAGAGYLPFLVERLFMYFLSTPQGQNLRAHQYPIAKSDYGNNVHLKNLREMKDLGWKARSGWLINCWANYRNLYLNQAHGKEWVAKYLTPVTPKKIQFAELANRHNLAGG